MRVLSGVVRRRVAFGFVTSVVAVAAAAATTGAAAAPSASPSIAGDSFAVVSADPLPATLTTQRLASLRSKEASASATDAGANPLAAPSATPLAAAVSLPGGFYLVDPGYRRSDYVYDSDTAYIGTYMGTGPYTLEAEVTAQLHQVVIGGSSHTWQLTMNMAQYTNPGNLSWAWSATYWCGVNRSLATDPVCDEATGAAPSNAWMSVNTMVNKPWGSTNSITVYPEVQATVIFSNGVTQTAKFRGWDTCSRASTTKLNATSSGHA